MNSLIGQLFVVGDVESSGELWSTQEFVASLLVYATSLPGI